MSGRAALALAVANVAAGVLNYLFQVHAAAVLDATEFGMLSAWLAEVTLASAAATIVQFFSLDHRIADARFTKLSTSAGVLAVVVLAAHVALGRQAPRLVIGGSAVAGAFLLFAGVGQLQARLRLGVVAAATLVTAAIRFALPFGWPRDARGPSFYVAHAAACFAGVVTAAVLLAVLPAGAAAPAGAAPPQRVRLGRPALLALTLVLFPFLDVLVVSRIQDDATTGAFSRIALASRIVFFGGTAVLQVMLPHQLHAGRTGEPLPRFVVVMERWLTPVLLVGATLLAAILDRALLHPRGEERTWLFASCLAAALLVAILGHVQRLAAEDRLGVATGCVLGVVLTSAAAAGAALLARTDAEGTVARYVVGAVIGDVLVLLFARWAQMRSPARAA